MIKRVVAKGLLQKFPVEAVEQINQIIRNINNAGDFHLIQHECNFDVEMASNIRIDCINDTDLETIFVGIEKEIFKMQKGILFRTLLSQSLSDIEVSRIIKYKRFIVKKWGIYKGLDF